MPEDVKPMRIGPLTRGWSPPEGQGDCPDCGGQCDDGCGRHKAGCLFGGILFRGYWLIADGCPLYHGEKDTP